MESPSGTETMDTTTDLPVVFQCQHCNTILSDSLAFVAANNDTKTITVNRVSASVDVSTKLVTSTDGIDQGSTYSPLICHGCESTAGRVYRTTPRVLDHLRDAFTFDVEKLSIYQVGSSDVSLPGETADLNSGPTLKELKETTLKMQVLICTMHQRIINIEQSLEIEEGEPLSSLLASSTALKAMPVMKPKDQTSQALRGVRNGDSGGTAGALNDGREEDVLSAIDDFPSARHRGKRVNQLTADTPQSSDAESSGSEASSTRGGRKRNSSNPKTSRGRVVAQTQRGASQTLKGAESNLLASVSRKRAMVQEDGDTSSDFTRGLEQVSPIKKKVNSRSRKQ